MITMTSKGQFTIPAAIRRDMGLDPKGATARLEYDESKKRFYVEKPSSIDDVISMNQAALKRRNASLAAYKSGDGFRAHTARRYGSR